MKWYIKIWNSLKILWLKLIPYKRDEGKLVKRDGIQKDPEDERDYVMEEAGEELPISYSLPINAYDYVKSQGSWNSCASHAMATAIEISHDVNKTNLQVPLSERHHYYIARQDMFRGSTYMGNYPENKGMYARVMLQVAQREGICPEKLCPYISSEMNQEPGPFAFGFSHLWKIKHYYRILDVQTAKEVLNMDYPILVGFLMTPSFRSFTGPISPDEVSTGGGHEVIIYGYDDETQEFLCINSWGKRYKDNGLMRVPYAFYEKNGIDMWTITIRENDG